MEVGVKRHGKRSDKETQSPVLKVFKDMMQRENKDPEKANLLKEKQENRKRRQYSASRSKSDRNQRSCDSSSSEKQRRSVQYKMGVDLHEQRIKDYNQTRSQSVPFQSDKKDSWWFWSGSEKKRSEDTCSCVSCALKRIASSEYTCIACLGVLFLLSVLVAFTVLFRTVPIVAKDLKPASKPAQANSEMLKKKIQMLQRGYSDETLRDVNKERRLWDDTMTRHLSSLTGLHGNDFDDGNFREANALEESVMKSDTDLSSVLDTDKLNDGLSSERLRNFYKKLIQTDAQIRNLKKGVSGHNSLQNLNENNYADRFKRSIKLRRPNALLKFNINKKEAKETPIENTAQLHKFNLFYPPFYSNATKKKTRKFKRFVNGSDEPTGFLIEKKQILVQYKPHSVLKKVPKCSHAPKESKSHEKQLKHPFYKNTQRLDELLDQFLDKNLPEMMVDPFGVNVLFKQNQKIKAHKTNLKIETEKPIKKPVTKAKSSEKSPLIGFKHKPKIDKEFFDLVTSKHRVNGKVTSTSTPSYDVLLSVSTIINPGLRKFTKSVNNDSGRTPSLLERVPHIRKLMQADEENEETLGYEDLQEVLADDTETHDETDNIHDIKKRMEDYTLENSKIPNNPSKSNPPGVHNPNWKGPMPLYPDELSSMIKQAAIQNVNKIQIPVNTKDISSEVDSAEQDLSDIEYIESYSDSKYDKLVRMAQAYSDYGVLEGKKELVRNENKPIYSKGVERIVKLSVNKGKSLKDALLNRFKKSKCTASEGIRFEVKPTTNSREDSPAEIMKVLHKHVKVTNPAIKGYIPPSSTTINNDYTLLSAAVEKSDMTDQIQKIIQTEGAQKNDVQNDYSNEGGVIFTFAKPEVPTVEEETPDIYADNTVVFALGKKDKSSTKSSFNRIGQNLEESINEGSDVIRIGKRSLKSVDYKDKSNPEDDGNLEFTNNIQNNDDVLHSNANKGDMKAFIDVKYIDRQSNVNNITTEKYTNNTHSNVLTADTANDTNKCSNGSSLFDGNIITSLISPNVNSNSSEMDLGEFFRMMANWFGLLAESDNSYNESTTVTNEPESNIIKFTTRKTSSTTQKLNKSSDIEYPMYDSDMIENIGHRSRVLMAVEDGSDNVSNVVDASTVSNQEKREISSSSTVDGVLQPVLTATTLLFISPESSNTNILTSKEPTTELTSTDNTADKTKNTENKTVVKRDVADDSNLIFWNDMYDDEYGIKLDPIDNAIRDKHNVKGMDFMKRSGGWIQDKMRNFANNFRKDRVLVTSSSSRRRLRGAKYQGTNPYSENVRNKYVKRDVKYDDDEADQKPDSFAALTAKMKEVCKEAAKAVQQTKNLKVRQNDKEDTESASIMQQLLRLMTDLIDFQVRQKTCVKLPPDLQEFLDWLTAPSNEQLEPKSSKQGYHDDNFLEKPTEQVMDLITTPSSEKEEVHPDSRSDCLGTLHAVQDLMQQFDEMADEDKSKMTGIREYLENQLQFLHKQLTAYDDYKVSNMFEEGNPTIRFRRDLRTPTDQTSFRNQFRRRKRRFKRRFIKNFGKKHTRTTASIYDGYMVTEGSKFGEVIDKIDENDDKREIQIEKRNLRDVYFRALEEAKKPTTFKNVHKEELDGFDNAQIVRIEN